MSVNHNPDIGFDVTFGPPPSAVPAYRLLIIVPLATNSLDSDDFMAFPSIADAAAAEDAGDISADTLARVTVALSQQPRPDIVYVGAVDLVGTETYAAALGRLEGVLGNLFFGVCIESRAAADVLAVSAAAEASRIRYFASVDDAADWFSGDVPSDLSAAAGRDYTGIVLHDVAAAHPDVAWLAGLLATDPNLKAARSERQLAATPLYEGTVTNAQRLAAFDAGANIAGQWGPANNYLKPGQSLSGRSVTEIITLEWFRRETISRIAARSVALAPRKWPVNSEGQALLEDILRGLAAQGEAVGHFDPGQTIVNILPITAQDRDLGRLRAEFIATLQGHTRTFLIGGQLDRQLVITEA